MPDPRSTHAPRTALSTSSADRIVVRDLDLCGDLIGKTCFSEFFLLLLTGRRPTEALIALTDATLVAIAEHGITPSVLAARMTYASDPAALQGALAAGLLGCGRVVLGASEAASVLMGRIAAELENGTPLDDVVGEHLHRWLRIEKQALPGFGHRQHKQGDPRATALLALARNLGSEGPYIRILDAIDRLHSSYVGRRLPMNVTAAIPAVLIDAGFPPAVIKGIPLIARSAGIVAHLLEESENPIAFPMADAAVAWASGTDNGSARQGSMT